MTRPALIAAALCGVLACGDDQRTAAPTARVLVESEGRTVVARVNDRPIFADCVETQAREHGLTARAALDECIDFELLAQEAEARGFASHPAALEVQRREAVRKLVITDFEANHDGPEDVPMDVVRSLWNNPSARAKFDHPEYRWCLYMRAPLDRKAPADSPEAIAAEAAARRVYRALAGRTMTADEFIEAMRPFQQEYGLEVLTKPYHTPLEGRADKTFARALFDIPAVGRISKPVRTPWGWDILLLTHVEPALHMTVEQAADEIRQAVFTKWRESAFHKWAAGFSTKLAISVADDWTEKLPADPFELQ